MEQLVDIHSTADSKFVNKKTGDETQLSKELYIKSYCTTPTAGDSLKIATTAFVNSEISGDVGVSNSALVKTALNASGDAPIYACRKQILMVKEQLL